jgi:hypothetical protein
MTGKIGGFTPKWSAVRNARQVLECMHDSATVGSVSLGLGSLGDEPSILRIDMIKVRDDPAYRGGTVSCQRRPKIDPLSTVEN